MSGFFIEVAGCYKNISGEKIEIFRSPGVEDGSCSGGNNCGNIGDWPGFIRPASFLQTDFWTEFKGQNGWVPYLFYINVKNLNIEKNENKSEPACTGNLEDTVKLSFYVLVRTIKKFFSIAYVPLAPDLSFFNGVLDNFFLFPPDKDIPEAGSKTYTGDAKSSIAGFYTALGKKIRTFLPKNTAFIRFDPPFQTYGDVFPGKMPKPLIHAFSPVQPPDTVILDLRLTENELLEQMKPKWRYNIRLGEKKGVEIKQGGIEFLDDFYKIYLETAERDGIALHSKGYYARLLSLAAEKKENVKIYLAYHEGDILAGIITYFSGRDGVYLYGASSNNKRNLMPAYSLQWRAIRDAKIYGCLIYDFYGIPPVDNPAHPMYGLYRFKTGFGGVIVHRIGSLDMPVNKITYNAFRFAEILRAFYYKRLKKLFIKKGHRG